MATVDRYEWIVQTAALLPGGVGTVSFDNTTNTFTIAVKWDDDRDGAVDSTDPEFSLEIRP